MSRDVSLIFDVNVEESTSVIKNQLQGIFDEINKQPQSIKVAIDEASFNNAITKLREIRELMSETDSFKNSEYLVDELMGGMNRLRDKLSDINSVLTTSKNLFQEFAGNGYDGVLNVGYQVSSLLEEMMRLRSIVGEINSKDLQPQVYGGFTAMDASSLIAIRDSLGSLSTYTLDFASHLEEIKILLRSAFDSSEGGIVNLESHLSKIVEYTDLLRYGISGVQNAVNNSSGGGSWFQIGQMDDLSSIKTNVESLVEIFTGLKQILTEISGLINQINSKDFNITNKFSTPKIYQNNRQELALLKDETIETYKAIEQMYDTLMKMSTGGNIKILNQAFTMNSNGSISDVFALANAMEYLGTSVEDIGKKNRIDSMTSLKLKIDEIYNEFVKLYGYIGSVSNIKLLIPDTSKLDKAREALSAYVSEKQAYENASKNMVMQNMGVSNVAKNEITVNTNPINTASSNLSDLQIQVDVLKTNVNSLIEEVGKKFSDVFNFSQVNFNTSKIITFASQIKSQFETLKANILSGISEIKTTIDGVISSYSGGNTALPIQNIKEYLTVLQTIQGTHANMGEVVGQFQNLSTAISDLTVKSNPEALEAIIPTINSIDRSITSLNETVSNTSGLLNNFISNMNSLADIKSVDEVEILKNEINSLYKIFLKYEGQISRVNSFAKEQYTTGGKTISDFVNSIMTSPKVMNSYTNVMSDGVTRVYTSLQDMKAASDSVIENLLSFQKGRSDSGFLNGLKNDLLQIIKLYDTFSNEYNRFIRDYESGSYYKINTSKFPTAGEINAAANQLSEYQRAKENVSKVTIVDQNETSMLEKYADIINEIKNQFDILKTDIVKGLTEIKTAISSLPKNLKVSISGKGAADAIKAEAEAERELGKATSERTSKQKEATAATEEEVNAITKFNGYALMAQTKSVITNNKNAAEESSYIKLEANLRMLSAALQMAEEKGIELDAAFKMMGKDGEVVFNTINDSFNKLKGVIADTGNSGSLTITGLNQNLAAMQELLNKANAKSDKAPSILDSAAYQNLNTQISLTRDIFAEMDKNGLSLEQALKSMGINGATYVEAVKLATSELNVILKETDGETQQIDRDAKQAKASTDLLSKTYSTVASLTSTLSSAENKSSTLTGNKFFGEVSGFVTSFKEVIDLVESGSYTIEQAFNKVGLSSEDSFVKAQIASYSLRTAINETAKESKEAETKVIELSKAYEALNKSEKLTKENPVLKNSNTYSELKTYSDQLSKSIKEAERNSISLEQAFINLGYDGETIFREINNSVAKLNNEIINHNGSTKGVSYEQVFAQIASATGVLNSAESKFSNTQYFVSLQSNVNALKAALGDALTSGIDLEQAFANLGTTGSTAISNTKILAYALKTVMNETTQKTEVTIDEVTKLTSAWDALNKSQSLIYNNPVLQNSQEYQTLYDYASKLSDAIDLTQNESIKLDDAFKRLGVDGDEIFKQLSLSASKLRNVMIQTGESGGAKPVDILAQISSLTSLINSKNSSKLIGTEPYDNVTSSINMLNSALEIAKNEEVSLEQAFQRLGTTSVDALDSAKIAAYTLKIATSENKTEVETEKNNVTKLSAAYKELVKAQSLISRNPGLSNTKQYENLMSVVIALKDVIGRAENFGMTFSQSVGTFGWSEDKLFEDLSIALSKFNLEAMKTSLTITDVRNALAQLQTLSNKVGTDTEIVKTSDAYSNLESIILRTNQALAAAASGGMNLDQALASAGLDSTTYLSQCKDVTAAFKVELSAATGNAKELRDVNNKASKEQKEYQSNLNKAYNLLNNMQKASAKWTAAQTGKTSKEYTSIKNNTVELERLISDYKAGTIDADKFREAVLGIKNSFNQSSTAIISANENIRSFNDRFGTIIQRFGAWFGVTRIIMKVISTLKEMINTSIELDDAFTQLQIVTHDTESSYENFGDTVAKVAKRTATSMADITSSATTFARLGYSLEDSAQIAEYTAMLQNVGDIEVSDAQDAITAILKAFDEVNASDIESVMDKLVVTGNNFPISVSQIAEGMNNASSALAAAGNSFDQSVALLTAANTTIQDAAKSSTALRTIAARIRKTDTELEDLGESITTSKYDGLVKSLAGLNIALVDSNNEFRSTYDILSDIAEKWDSLSTMEQSALAETIAGTRQQAVFFSIIEQFQEASGSMDAMASSAGELEKSYSTYLDSTTAHVNQFKAAFEELSANAFNSGFLSVMVDIGKAFTDFLNALAKAKMLLPTIIVGSLTPKLVKLTTSMIAARQATISLASSIIAKKTFEKEDVAAVAALNEEERRVFETELFLAQERGLLNTTEQQRIVTEYNQIGANKGLEGSNYSLAASFKAVTSAIPVWGWVIIAITGAIAVFGALTKSVQEANEAFRENTSKVKEHLSTLEDYKDKVKEIYETEDDTINKLEKYRDLRQEIVDGYDVSISKIDDETKATQILNDALDEKLKKERSLYLLENKDNYNKAKEKLASFEEDPVSVWDKLTQNRKNGDYKGVKIWRDSSFDNSDYQISNEIQKIFDYTTDPENGFYGIGTDAKNKAELLEAYSDAYIRFGEIVSARERTGLGLTKDEQALYDSLEAKYRSLKEELGEDNIDYEGTILYNAKLQAEELIDSIPKGKRSFEEWQNALIESANGDEYVIKQIKELTLAVEELEETEIPSAIDEINTKLEELEGKLESVKESISTASDYFDDIAKVIKNNSDADKFFASDEMIDMLEKYPELNDAVLVTAYGYKFEEKALEDLRKAKLEEQKADLYTKLQETQTAMDAADKKIEAYSAELVGVHNLADAEEMLAVVESELAMINLDPGKSEELEAKRAKILNYIDSVKKATELRQDYEKSVMQYTILGNVFDDLKDSTSDATSALNAQKSAMKDLNDEYKDAQDAIEDLVKLTMDMIV